MAEQQKKRRPRKPRKEQYVQRSNALHITIYDPAGSPVPANVFEECENSIIEVVKRYGLLTNRATT